MLLVLLSNLISPIVLLEIIPFSKFVFSNSSALEVLIQRKIIIKQKRIILIILMIFKELKLFEIALFK